MVRYVTLTFILIITLAMTACGNNSAATTPEPAADLAVIATEATDDPAEEPTNAAEAADTIETTISANAPSSNYLDSYTIDDTGFGTQVNAVVDDETKTRTIESNALPNHETGEFPNPGNPNTISAQERSWTYTTKPIYVGTASFAREPGVAINGVKFEPGTAERATCESGEVHSIEAIQDVTDLGLDFNNAHVQPTGEYHYHGVSALLVELYDLEQDLVHVGFAADGYLIYYSKSGAYQSSYRLGEGERAGANCTYTPGGPNGGESITFDSIKDGSLTSDWDYDASYGQLDECNGITVDGEYIYLITNDYPYIPRCLMGEFTGPGAPPAGGGQGGGPGVGGPGGGPPDFAAVAEILNITEQEFMDALGPPPPNLEATAATLGITLKELEDVLETAGVQLRRQ